MCDKDSGVDNFHNAISVTNMSDFTGEHVNWTASSHISRVHHCDQRTEENSCEVSVLLSLSVCDYKNKSGKEVTANIYHSMWL